MKIEGVVKDAADKSPLGGITVRIVNNGTTLTGALTDDQGKFMIRDVPYTNGMSIAFSSIGYANQAKPVPNQDSAVFLISLKSSDAVFESSPIKPKGETTYDVSKKRPMLFPFAISVAVVGLLSITGYLLYTKYTK